MWKNITQRDIVIEIEECGIIAVVVKAVNMATAVTDRREKDSTKTRLGKQHTAEGFTTKASMKNVTVSLAYWI